MSPIFDCRNVTGSSGISYISDKGDEQTEDIERKSQRSVPLNMTNSGPREEETPET